MGTSVMLFWTAAYTINGTIIRSILSSFRTGNLQAVLPAQLINEPPRRTKPFPVTNWSTHSRYLELTTCRGKYALAMASHANFFARLIYASTPIQLSPLNDGPPPKG